jgi:chemotaxis regulatin CheY-phosphate phosphatase CheZ
MLFKKDILFGIDKNDIKFINLVPQDSFFKKNGWEITDSFTFQDLPVTVVKKKTDVTKFIEQNKYKKCLNYDDILL